MRVPSPARVVPVWALVLLVIVSLAASCTSPGQAPSNNQRQQPGPPQGQGPADNQERSEDQGPPAEPGRGEQGFGLLGVGSHLPSDQECAARVQRARNDQQEARPENTAANQVVPDRVVMPIWTNFTAKANQQFVSRIDGHFSGTTAQILDWGACKWGLPADLLKAVAVQESDWRQSTTSDESNNPQDCVGGARPPCPTSFGIMQLKHTVLPGSYPLSAQSTPFNVDYYGARIRACYEGWVTYLHDDHGPGSDYGPGDIWGCTGWHWSGHWKDSGAKRYVDRVHRYLDTQPWHDWTNQGH